MTDAAFRVHREQDNPPRVVLSGDWSLRQAKGHFARLREQLAPLFAERQLQWDLREVERLDSAAGAMLLQGWQYALSDRILLRPEQTEQLAALAALPRRDSLQSPPVTLRDMLKGAWCYYFDFIRHLVDFVMLVGALVLEVGYLFRKPRQIPWKEISANIYKGGVMALPVTALVGFMIGIAMSYLMALQLRKFGADIFIINILGMSIIREFGPILMAVLVAGRSGSAMTAQIGVMRVTEEIDALAAMGISRVLRLVLPKVVGLVAVAPLLVFWTSCWALLGAMLAAKLQLGISFDFFIEYLPRAVKPVNLTLAMLKALMFGLLIALVACHFGLRIKPNTESLSSSTTASVVVAITVVILVDAVFAILTRSIGL